MSEQTLEDVLGLPQECRDFLDGEVRIAYPVLMEDMSSFMNHFQYINVKSLWNNMIFDEGVNAVKGVLKHTFFPSIDDEKANEEIVLMMRQINAGNYPRIMKMILRINGINLKTDEDEKNVTEV